MHIFFIKIMLGNMLHHMKNSIKVKKKKGNKQTWGTKLMQRKTKKK